MKNFSSDKNVEFPVASDKSVEFLATSDKNVEFLVALSLLTRTGIKSAINEDTNDIRPVLELLKFISPASKWNIKNSVLSFQPGPLLGGKHAMAIRDISKLISFLCIAGTFSMELLVLEITGVTEEVETLQRAHSKILGWFQIDKMSVTVKKRGFSPAGEGVVLIRMDPKKKIGGIDRREEEKIAKISGLVVTSRVSADISQRIVKRIKKSLGSLGTVKVDTIVSNKTNSGPSPGYECAVYLESKNSIFYSTGVNSESPESTARMCCMEVLKELESGAAVDRKFFPLILTLMALSEGISYLRIGKSEEELLLLGKATDELLGSEHKIKDGVLTVIGCNYSNVFKPL